MDEKMIKKLQYWHRLEHFYPYNLKECSSDYIKSYYISNSNDLSNFMKLEVPKDKEVRYYEVYFGIFQVDQALDSIIKTLHAENEFRERTDDRSCFCKFRLLSNALLDPDPESFKVSSFPWAVGRLKTRERTQNNIFLSWKDDFENYQENLFLDLKNQLQSTPFCYEACEQIRNNVCKSIGWNIKFFDHWIRVDRVLGKKTIKQTDVSSQENEEKVIEKETSQKVEAVEQAEISDQEVEALERKREEEEQIDKIIQSNDLLNSFYVRDLERVIFNIKEKRCGEALTSYLSEEKVERIDVEKDKEELFRLFNPKSMLYGKWPSGYPLRSMQQLAVNIAMHKEIKLPIFSVNGPPGTGKTTLLRDIISANIIERAMEVCHYTKPDDVFGKSLGSITWEQYTVDIKEIKDSLKKYGILVASNNNAAVKNITMELPAKNSLSESYRKIYSYFSGVSDQILKKENGSWGVCAASLGNRANRSTFMDAFWPLKTKEDGIFNFNRFLIKQKKTNLEREMNWKEAVSSFQNAYKEVETEYKKLELYYQYLVLLRKLPEKERQYQEQKVKSEKNREILAKFRENFSNKQLEQQELDKEKQKIKKTTFLFSIRLRMKCKSQAIKKYKELEDIAYSFEQEIIKLDKQVLEQENLCKQDDERENLYKRQIQECKNKIQSYFCKIKDIHFPDDMVVPNETFLSDLIGETSLEACKKAQDTAPWNSKRINILREKLFLEAMNLHKALVENSRFLRAQLDTFSKWMRGQLEPSDQKKFAGALLQSFFLVVPVISTTFASVSSFLRYIKQEEIGLLLIDEAGQALPQSAVGAIWRSKKVVVVGDPLQIEPVVTIHDKTMKLLQQEFKQSNFIANKETSVQSLADQRNCYVGVRSISNNKFYIGSPLLVHGRCQRKIFDIANCIAYNNKMIYGTRDSANTTCVWIDVKGQAEKKHFVRAQAERIVPIVKKAFESTWEMEEEKKLPSLFVISPFRSVKEGVAQYFQENDFLYRELSKTPDEKVKEQVKQWIHTNIGTVHTFQGKEATTVIICLGVDSGTKGDGAIEWASKSPNILNVAVTRAKNNLYIVGDASKWALKPYFEEAYEICDKI